MSRIKPSREELRAIRRRRRWKGLFYSLLIVQLLIVIFSLGGDYLLTVVLGDQVSLKIPYRVLFFLGMVVGMALTALLIAFALTLSGAAAIAKGDPKPGWTFRAIRRVIFAGIVLSVCSVVLCGTAWFMIPEDQRDDIPETLETIKDEIDDQFK